MPPSKRLGPDFNVRMYPGDRDRLAEIAERECDTISGLIRRAIKQFLSTQDQDDRAAR
jgi:predicted transcriptional regulator